MLCERLRPEWLVEARLRCSRLQTRLRAIAAASPLTRPSPELGSSSELGSPSRSLPCPPRPWPLSSPDSSRSLLPLLLAFRRCQRSWSCRHLACCDRKCSKACSRRRRLYFRSCQSEGSSCRPWARNSDAHLPVAVVMALAGETSWPWPPLPLRGDSCSSSPLAAPRCPRPRPRPRDACCSRCRPRCFSRMRRTLRRSSEGPSGGSEGPVIPPTSAEAPWSGPALVPQ
mmetsp:Transcript_7494/g.15559  ORF Transcript_7494/g.15559 Transcript_7494/m.15559 type:complete len:228 (+) Transcript_7494:1274-1957(+)